MSQAPGFFDLFDKGQCGTAEYVGITQGGFIDRVDAKTCMTVELSQSEDMIAFTKCEAAIAVQDGNLDEADLWWPSTLDGHPEGQAEWTVKTFHPKLHGMEATAPEIIHKLQYREIANGGPPSRGQKLRIMAIGDYLTVGPDSQNNGYRLELHSILSANNRGPGEDPTMKFVGWDQFGDKGIDVPWSRGEAVQHGLIAQIHDHLIHNPLHDEDPFQHFVPNVVIIMAGSNDMKSISPGDDIALQPAINELEKLVITVYSRCGNCAILLAQIPPQGYVRYPDPYHRSITTLSQFEGIADKSF